MKFGVKKGLNIPILGALKSSEISEKPVSKVAILGPDFVGMKPSMLVKEGDSVKAGQPVFQCKKNPSAVFTAQLSGTVEAIHRGEKRAFQSLVLKVDSSSDHISFKNWSQKPVGQWTREEIVELLVESGEWVNFRQRPFEKVASRETDPKAVFITAIDTEPLAPNPEIAIQRWRKEFEAGVQLVAKLTTGKTFLCVGGTDIDGSDGAQTVQFTGPHPSGLVGTHAHLLYPPGRGREIWHIGYQNVIAIGALFLTGQLLSKKLVALVGPHASNPKIVETLRGAQVSELVNGEIQEESRVISGSVLNGHKCDEITGFVGNFHNQVSVIKEDPSRELLGWQSPGFDKFSLKRIYFSKLMPGKKFSFGSSTNGSKRAMVPVGTFESVMPLDILPTQLLRALVSEDIELAEELGCLELAEDDLSLCTFVAPGKVDFGPILRNNLNMIEAEG